MTPIVRDAVKGDVESVVGVHVSSFPDFFLTELGPRFLRQFYAALIEHESGMLCVANVTDGVVGFVGGATEQQGFYSDLLRRRKWRFGFAALPAIARRPSRASRVLRGRRRAQGHGETPPGACLMTIGVQPSAQGSGAGRALVEAFERALISRKVTSYSLTTDTQDNARANRFYRELDMTLRREVVTPEGRRLNEYWKLIDQSEEDSA